MSEFGGISSLVELIFSFGVALGFVAWQIYVTRKGIAQDRRETAAREAQEARARSSSDASP
jgi:hypothetical protein